MAGKYRPILHVHITDDRTGVLLADVDAPTTADGLAYYVSSRGIDESATEASIMAAVESGRREPRSQTPADETIVFERRHPISGVLEVAFFAHVEGKCPLMSCRWKGNVRWETDGDGSLLPAAERLHRLVGDAEVRLKKCECGWAVDRRATGRWIHVQTGEERCPTEAETASWGRPA